MQRNLCALLLLAGCLQGTLGARRLQQIDPSVNVALNQQIQGVINNAQPLVNSFAQSVSNGLRNFNYSSIDWEKFATKVNSAANETMNRILPQPNVTAINADAEQGMEKLNQTVVENIPKFYDNFHWERPTLLNETLNELPLKDVVHQAINDQEPLLDRPEFYKAMNSLPVRPIFADGSVESFAQTRSRSANAPAPAPQLDAVSSAVGTVIQDIGALAYNTSAAAPVASAIQEFTAAATAPAAGGQIVGPLATLINSLTTGTPLNTAIQQARSAVAATPVGSVVDNARSAVGTAIANSPIGAVVNQARNAAAPVESLLQSARTLAAAPVSTLLQRAGSTLNGAPGAAPILEGARTVVAQSPVGPLLQAARTAVASSPLAGIVNAMQNLRLPGLQGTNSNDAAQVNSYARAPAPSTGGLPINVSEIAQGFTQQLNAAINNGVPALLPENPIDLFVRAINNNGGQANTNDITTRQSFQETKAADGSSTMTPLDDAKTEQEADKTSEESSATESDNTKASADASAPETKEDSAKSEPAAETKEDSAKSESAADTKEKSAKSESADDTKEESAKSDSEASAPSTQNADSQSESAKDDEASSDSQSADDGHDGHHQ